MKNSTTIIALAAALVVVGALAFFLLSSLEPQGPVIIEKKPPVVNMTGIYDYSCVLCPSLNAIVDSIRSYNVSANLKSFNYNTTEGIALIEKYGIDRAPALIVSRNILEYPVIARMWTNLNASRTNDSFILYFLPPYRNFSSNSMDGLVNIVYISDSTCKDCYDVGVHKRMLEQTYHVVLYNQTYTDVSHDLGKEFIEKYNITAVPTIIMSPDASVYSGLMADWFAAGSEEPDGYFVFRNASEMGIYRNLKTGKIVNATV